MGDFREVRWTWQSDDTDVRVGRVTVGGTVSIADLIAHMREVAPDAGLEDIEVRGATVVCRRPANDDELAQRKAAVDQRRARLEAWERETLARLSAKYGHQTPPDPQ